MLHAARPSSNDRLEQLLKLRRPQFDSNQLNNKPASNQNMLSPLSRTATHWAGPLRSEVKLHNALSLQPLETRYIPSHVAAITSNFFRWLGRIRFKFPESAKRFLFSKISTPALGPTDACLSEQAGSWGWPYIFN